MNILNRLYRIFRAKINTDSVSEPFSDSGFRKKYRKQFREEYRGHENPPGEKLDPKLAGYYANLEVPYGSDLETVTRAWKKLLQKYHPDLHSNDPEKQQIANRLVQGLNQAYEEVKKHLAKN